MMRPFERPHMRQELPCPGCGRRLSGPTEDARRARVLTHLRNCVLFQQAAKVALDVEARPAETPP